MKKWFGTLVVGLGLVLVGCDSGGSGDGDSGGGDVTKIVVIGDSIGTGFGVATGFPNFLRSLSGVPVVNNSKASRQTGTGVGLASSLIASEQPSHLVVLLGTNDAIRGSVSGAVANLQRIADIGREAGVTVVIGTLPPIPRNSGEDSRAAQISSGIRGISGARIANIRGEMSPGNIADGVHPNNDGQRIIAVTFNERL